MIDEICSTAGQWPQALGSVGGCCKLPQHPSSYFVSVNGHVVEGDVRIESLVQYNLSEVLYSSKTVTFELPYPAKLHSRRNLVLQGTGSPEHDTMRLREEYPSRSFAE